MKIKDVIDEILVTVMPTKRRTTQVYYDHYFEMIRKQIGNRSLNTFSRKIFVQWISNMRKGARRKTFNDYVKFLNIIFNYAYQQRMIKNLVKFPKVDAHSKSGRVYTNAEIKRLWMAMNGSTKLQFILGFEMFMRLREALHLTWDKVDLESKTITLRAEDVKTGSKTGKGRTIPISQNAMKLLIELKKHSTSPYVFPNKQGNGPVDSNKKAWALAKKRARITGKARWHDLRHTALTLAVGQHKIPVALLCQVAGLSIRTLEKVYLHPQIEHLREVTDKINILEIA